MGVLITTVHFQGCELNTQGRFIIFFSFSFSLPFDNFRGSSIYLLEDAESLGVAMHGCNKEDILGVALCSFLVASCDGRIS